MKTPRALLTILVFLGLGIVAAKAGSAFEPLVGFQDAPKNPSKGKLFLHPDGNIYGTSNQTDTTDFGTVYRLTSEGKVRVLLPFYFDGPMKGREPDTGVVSDGRGFLWGTTIEGGEIEEDVNGGYTWCGTVFRLDLKTGVPKTMVSFTGRGGSAKGKRPTGLVHDGNGILWGMTSEGGADNLGTIFQIDVSTGKFTIVAEFTGDAGTARGATPNQTLVNDGNGFWWGTTMFSRRDTSHRFFDVTGNGTVFKINARTGEFKTVHEFRRDPSESGRNPRTALVSDGQGFLWGTGSWDDEMIFKIDVKTEAVTIVKYYQPMSESEINIMPNSALIPDGSGSLWGTTFAGGAGRFGSICKVDIATGVLTTVLEFTGPGGAAPGGAAPGSRPEADLIDDGKGSFWGTTSGPGRWNGTISGANDYGTIYKIDKTTGVLTTVSEFPVQSGDIKGSNPPSGLVSDKGDILRGVTAAGGAAEFGTIYSFNTRTGAFTTLAEFTGASGTAPGKTPNTSLLDDGHGLLWGTTQHGGPKERGSIYSYDPATGAVKTAVEFTNRSGPSKGKWPLSGLTAGEHGTLWGTTSQGGRHGFGTIYRFNPNTGVFKTVVEFTGRTGPAMGLEVSSPLVTDGGGFFWGTTKEGGPNNCGTIFKVHARTGALTTVVQFTNTSGPTMGSFPIGRLERDGKGFFWGTTYYGGPRGFGTIFKVNIDTGELTTVTRLNGVDRSAKGAHPFGGLLFDGVNGFWGTTSRGGAVGGGTIFHLRRNGVFEKAFDFTGYLGAVPGLWSLDGALVRHSDGNLYGAAGRGGVSEDGFIAGAGQIFRVRFGPSPVTLAADQIGANAATLRGTINPNGDATTVSFEWGTDPALATFQTASSGALATSTAPEAVSASLSGLSPATTYYFRVFGLNAANARPQRGVIRSFSTTTQ